MTPWTARREDDRDDWSVWDAYGRIAYAIDETLARQIAAVPDMLRALEALEACSITGCANCRELMDAALKKAKGEKEETTCQE